MFIVSHQIFKQKANLLLLIFSKSRYKEKNLRAQLGLNKLIKAKIFLF